MIHYIILLFMISTAPARATPVSITPQDLQALLVLGKPENTTIHVDGTEGVIETAPALKTAGLDSIQFPINLGTIAELSNATFHHVQSQPLKLQFSENGLIGSVPFEDRSIAASSRLGVLGFKNISVQITLNFSSESIEPLIQTTEVKVFGVLSGSGVFAPAMIRGKVRKLMEKTAKKYVDQLLSKPEVQSAFQKGLEIWGASRLGLKQSRIVAGEFKMNENGIQYEVIE